MTIRVYLGAVTVAPGPPVAGDLPAERFFVHASDVPEVWVETESTIVPERGRAVAFFFARPMTLGFERISGTIERTIEKRARRREDAAEAGPADQHGGKPG